MVNAEDTRLLPIAYVEAKAGFDEGGCPIGSVLARGGNVVAQSGAAKDIPRYHALHLA